MPDKTPTYRIDENLLRNKLLGYEVELNASRCGAIEEEISAMRFKKSIELPKVNVKILGAALLVLVFVTAVAFNFDSIKGMFSSDSEPGSRTVQQQETPAVSNPGPKPAANNVVVTETVAASTPTVAAVSNGQPPVNNANQAPVQPTAKKMDAAVSDKKADTTAGDNVNKTNANPVMAQPPTDSAAKVNADSKPDSAAPQQETPRKKKRRHRNANMEELKQSTLESNSSDDDVVVPQ